jgi:tetratricopeptide (TPR) repeat protein
MNLKAENIDKALEYFLQAVNLSENDDQKGLYLNYVASIYYTRQNYQQTRAYALRAIDARPNWGAPYILIGKSYAFSANSIGKDDFSQKAVYWVAVDKFMRAKAVDPACSEEANGLIRTYSAHFPPSDEIFMQGFKVGESYTVEGWINEKTTIREK